MRGESTTPSPWQTDEQRRAYAERMVTLLIDPLNDDLAAHDVVFLLKVADLPELDA